jgi:hypothetical protein
MTSAYQQKNAAVTLKIPVMHLNASASLLMNFSRLTIKTMIAERISTPMAPAAAKTKKEVSELILGNFFSVNPDKQCYPL